MNNSSIDGLVNSEFAPEYEERKATHIRNRDNTRASGRAESWPVRGIAYSHGLTRDQPEPIIINGIRLDGMEAVIYTQVMNLLAAKERDHIDVPVVVLDLGGMYGVPLIRLAKATEDLVKRSKIVYVVSNLTFNPATMSDEEVRNFTGLGHSDYDDFFLQNRRLVNFLVSDAEELRDAQISLPNGKSMSLYGHIDLIHEQNALGKSQLLDSDLPTLGTSLSSYGTIFLGDKDANNTVNPTAFRIGERNLLQIGVKKIDLGNNAVYNVYAKPKAPEPLFSSG